MNKKVEPLKFVDLFAGLGGFRLGLEGAGLECVYGADNNEHAAKIYETNFQDKILKDITKVNPEEMPDFDVLAGGFPCQPFSIAGEQLGFEDSRGTVFFDVCRILDYKKPEVVFLENVKNLASHDGGRTLEVITRSLENLGYTVSMEILNSVDYGVPQSRERVFIVCSRSGKKFDFSKVEKVERVPLKNYLNLNKEESFEWLDEETYVIIEEELRKTQPKTGLQFIGYRKGTVRKAGVAQSGKHLSRVHRQQNRIYSAEGSHPTISSQESNGRVFVHTEISNGRFGVRKMTIDECFRVFGFPESYKKVGALTNLYNRIGNSVPVPVGKLIWQQIVKQLF